MLPLEHPDRIHVAFDDHRLVANAGLLLPVTQAHHLGLGELVDCHVDLGDAPGRANAGDKMLTLVASALAGGDYIDDAAALRAGGTARVLGCVVKAPSTLGTFLRSFRWGHARQLDRVSRELLALERLTRLAAPSLLRIFGVGPDTAAALMIAAGDNPHRLHSEAAFASLCGANPIPASSGKTNRHRLNRGGDRQANAALYRIVLVRLRHDVRTREYMRRRTGDGMSKSEVMQRGLTSIGASFLLAS